MPELPLNPFHHNVMDKRGNHETLAVSGSAGRGRDRPQRLRDLR
jgi:hypothetical protein